MTKATARARPATERQRRRYYVNDRRHWNFDKTFSINTLVSIVGMAIVVGGPVLVWGRAMEGRVQSLEIMQAEKSKIEQQRDADTREQRVSLATRLDKMDEKLTAMQVQVGQLIVQLNLSKPLAPR